jgi:hypothetical protein
MEVEESVSPDSGSCCYRRQDEADGAIALLMLIPDFDVDSN